MESLKNGIQIIIRSLFKQSSSPLFLLDFLKVKGTSSCFPIVLPWIYSERKEFAPKGAPFRLDPDLEGKTENGLHCWPLHKGPQNRMLLVKGIMQWPR